MKPQPVHPRPSTAHPIMAWVWGMLLFTLVGACQAQEWPTSPIKLIIPFAPGGGNDGAGRLVAKPNRTDTPFLCSRQGLWMSTLGS